MGDQEPTIADVMEKKVLTAELNASAKDCAKSMAKRGVSSAVIVESGSAVGIVTERDLVSKVMADGLDPSKVLVRDIMSTPLITVGTSATVGQAAELMASYRIRRLVVIDGNGKLVGIITAGDIATMMAEKQGYRDASLNAIARYKEGETGGPYQ